MHAGMPYTSEDYLDTVAVFGGVRKNVTSKDFKGGEVVCVLGGAEINLSQSIINGQASLELVNVLGGTKLIVPPHWEIKSEVVAIFGGIEDKRIQQNTPAEKVY
jgi:predicted membrane protein